VLAYVLAGRIFKTKQAVIATAGFLVLVTAGMIYGTTFRNLKGSEDRQDLGQYSENILMTLDQVSRGAGMLDFAFASLAERLDGLSSVAVVVSTYEQLAPYEQGYGIENNIIKDTTTFFIPRFLWPDKPVASEIRAFSGLYFNYDANSFAITPIADLLRNFGIIGIPIGMMILGIVIRMIYSALVAGQPVILWRRTVYFMLLTAISYESFYGLIAPSLFRTGILAIVGILIVTFCAARLSAWSLKTR
jgi:hypothetical protein